MQTYLYIYIYYAKSLQSCPTLCDPIDGSPPGSPVPGILQARTLEWAAISFSNAWKWKVKVKVKSCPTLRDPMDCSLTGSSVHGIFQARVLEWGAIAFSDIYIYIYIKHTPGELVSVSCYNIISHPFFHGKGRKRIWIFSPYIPHLYHLCNSTSHRILLHPKELPSLCKMSGNRLQPICCHPYKTNGLLKTQIHRELGTNILWGWVLFYRRWFCCEIVTNIWCYFSIQSVYEHRWTTAFSLQTLKTHLQNLFLIPEI